MPILTVDVNKAIVEATNKYNKIISQTKSVTEIHQVSCRYPNIEAICEIEWGEDRPTKENEDDIRNLLISCITKLIANKQSEEASSIITKQVGPFSTSNQDINAILEVLNDNLKVIEKQEASTQTRTPLTFYKKETKDAEASTENAHVNSSPKA